MTNHLFTTKEAALFIIYLLVQTFIIIHCNIDPEYQISWQDFARSLQISQDQ